MEIIMHQPQGFKVARYLVWRQKPKVDELRI